MVHKRWLQNKEQRDGFENDVKMYGTQAAKGNAKGLIAFENDVKMYGTQASHHHTLTKLTFENDVKMYGTQA